MLRRDVLDWRVVLLCLEVTMRAKKTLSPISQSSGIKFWKKQP